MELSAIRSLEPVGTESGATLSDEGVEILGEQEVQRRKPPDISARFKPEGSEIAYYRPPCMRPTGEDPESG